MLQVAGNHIAGILHGLGILADQLHHHGIADLQAQIANGREDQIQGNALAVQRLNDLLRALDLTANEGMIRTQRLHVVQLLRAADAVQHGIRRAEILVRRQLHKVHVRVLISVQLALSELIIVVPVFRRHVLPHANRHMIYFFSMESSNNPFPLVHVFPPEAAFTAGLILINAEDDFL